MEEQGILGNVVDVYHCLLYPDVQPLHWSVDVSQRNRHSRQQVSEAVCISSN